MLSWGVLDFLNKIEFIYNRKNLFKFNETKVFKLKFFQYFYCFFPVLSYKVIHISSLSV
jgi:hypothetical protein